MRRCGVIKEFYIVWICTFHILYLHSFLHRNKVLSYLIIKQGSMPDLSVCYLINSAFIHLRQKQARSVDVGGKCLLSCVGPVCPQVWWRRSSSWAEEPNIRDFLIGWTTGCAAGSSWACWASSVLCFMRCTACVWRCGKVQGRRCRMQLTARWPLTRCVSWSWMCTQCLWSWRLTTTALLFLSLVFVLITFRWKLV